MFVSVFFKISVNDKNEWIMWPRHALSRGTPLCTGQYSLWFISTPIPKTNEFISGCVAEIPFKTNFKLYVFWSHIVAYQLSRDGDLGTTSKLKRDRQLTRELYYKVLSNICPHRCQHLKIAARITLYCTQYTNVMYTRYVHWVAFSWWEAWDQLIFGCH